MGKSDKRRCYYVLSTHWDREWYQPFQDYRYRLVQLLDRVIDGMATGKLRGPFQTDGQAIILDDYLEIRPERRETIEKLAKEGKFKIGPWYVLPDEFIVSGESLVRNIRLGRQIARAYGGVPSSAGFVCDLFGHNSQIPQILAGFGIHGALIWRGDNHLNDRVLLWRGADGTEVPCYRFGHRGYCSYAIAVRGLEKPHAFDAAQTEKDLRTYLDAEAKITPIDPILVFDGADHTEWDPENYSVLTKYMGDNDSPYRVIHGTLDDYLAELIAQKSRIEKVIEGELREPARHPNNVDGQWLIPCVLSSRVNIKQSNAECQNLLCQWAEPLSSLATLMLKQPYPQGYLNVAWKWLLQNHPHDSICGCSIDLVHQDMVYRFSQCRQIAERLTVESSRAVAKAIVGEISEKEARVVLFNPVPQTFDGVTEVTLQIPTAWPKFNEFFGFEPKPAFRIYDTAGNEVPYQRLSQAMNRKHGRIWSKNFPTTYFTDDVRVALKVEIPAGGYTTLMVKAVEAEGTPTRYGINGGLATSERSMENEHLAVTVESNGTLMLKDKKAGAVYDRLLTFEDIADIGDGWFHGQAVNDECVCSSACAATVSIVHNGPQMTTFRIRTAMKVPAEFKFDSMTRAQELTEMMIDSTVTLRAGSDRVEVHTTIQNTAKDHRVRVLLPTQVKAQTYLADGQFDVVERPIALRTDNDLYRELEVEGKPQQSWTAVFDGSRGLGVVSVGQMESAVRDQPERPIALTLFRGTRRTVLTDGQPEGQLNGSLEFRYWLTPVSGKRDIARLFGLSQLLSGGIRSVQMDAEDLRFERPAATLPPTAGYLHVPAPLVATSLRHVDARMELRVFNPTMEKVDGVIELAALPGVRWLSAQPVDLESAPRGEKKAIAGGKIPVTLRAKEITTLALEYAAG